MHNSAYRLGEPTLLNTSREIHSFKPKNHTLEASASRVFVLNKRISLEGFWRVPQVGLQGKK